MGWYIVCDLGIVLWCMFRTMSCANLVMFFSTITVNIGSVKRGGRLLFKGLLSSRTV